MREYHKIQTVWLRDPATKHRTLLDGQWAMPEFEFLKDVDWVWTEKIDGTNVRVMWDGERVTFGGRTDTAQMPTHLLSVLQGLFPADLLSEAVPPCTCLYGEGFGAKIQKRGGDYKPDGCAFALFDVSVGGLALEKENVSDIAGKLGCNTAPVVNWGTLCEAIAYVRDGQHCSIFGTAIAEGLVMRPATELQNRQGERIITKIKAKDFN